MYLRRLFFMKLVIDSISSNCKSSLHLKLGGFSIEVSDVSNSGRLAVVDESGKIFIEFLSAEIDSVPDFPAKPDVSQNVDSEAFEDDVSETVHEETVIKSVPEVQNSSPDILFQRLVALRRQIAQEVKLPPYIIFHDTTLKDMLSKLPVDLDEMKEVSGVGQAKLEKYGIRFVEAIKEYLAKSA
jgi:superfamily II DNA helicase RecQ